MASKNVRKMKNMTSPEFQYKNPISYARAKHVLEKRQAKKPYNIAYALLYKKLRAEGYGKKEAHSLVKTELKNLATA